MAILTTLPRAGKTRVRAVAAHNPLALVRCPLLLEALPHPRIAVLDHHFRLSSHPVASPLAHHMVSRKVMASPVVMHLPRCLLAVADSRTAAHRRPSRKTIRT